MSNRLARVGELLKRELSQCIERDLEFPDVLVTIHEVVVAPDLRNADVYIGVVGGGENGTRKVVEKLASNRGMLQTRVMKRVVLKYTPKLHFHADDSVARGVSVVSLLDSLAEDPLLEAGFAEDEGKKNKGSMLRENNSVAEIGEAVAAASRIGVISHRRPDGDAIGSTIAVVDALEALGKTVIAINDDGVPESLRFLPGSEKVRTPAELDGEAEVDLVIALDSAGKDRIGDESWGLFSHAPTLVNIDHHASNDHFGDLNYVDVVSPATGQIVFEILTELGWAITEAARDNLYVAISTDTGSFRYPNTTATTYRIAAELIGRGLDLGWINQMIYETYPARRVFALRELLEELELHCNGRAVCTKLNQETIDRLEIEPGDTEGLIDVIRSIDSVIVAVSFEDMPDGKIRVSARSKSDSADVGKICAQFGGGGHKLAAGTRMKGPINEAAERFLEAVKETLDGRN